MLFRSDGKLTSHVRRIREEVGRVGVNTTGRSHPQSTVSRRPLWSKDMSHWLRTPSLLTALDASRDDDSIHRARVCEFTHARQEWNRAARSHPSPALSAASNIAQRELSMLEDNRYDIPAPECAIANACIQLLRGKQIEDWVQKTIKTCIWRHERMLLVTELFGKLGESGLLEDILPYPQPGGPEARGGSSGQRRIFERLNQLEAILRLQHPPRTCLRAY